MFAEYSLCVGTFLEADSMVRNKAGNVPDFIYLLSTCIRAYSMRGNCTRYFTDVKSFNLPNNAVGVGTLILVLQV